MMQRLFPHYELRNIRIFYLLTLLTNAWFVLPNWMFLFGKYLSKPEIGFVDAAAILLGIFLEIPSGWISDVFGKKRILIFGNLCLALGPLIMGVSTTFSGFLIGNLITFVGFSFNSGSFEAFSYDSLVEKGKEKDYDKVVSRTTSLSIGMSLITVFLGGYMFSIDARLPFFGWALFSLLAVVALLFTKEPIIDTEHVTLQSSLNKLKDGVKTIFSIRFRDILLPILVIAALSRVPQGVVRQSMAFYYSFNGETFGYVVALVMIPVLFVTARFDKILKKLGTQRLIKTILLGYTFMYLFGTVTHGPIPGIFYFLMLMLGEKIAYQTLTVSANERISSGHRATALSVISLISQLPYVILMFLFASWTEPAQIPYLIFGFGAVAAITLIYTFTRKSLSTQEIILTPPKSS